MTIKILSSQGYIVIYHLRTIFEIFYIFFFQLNQNEEIPKKLRNFVNCIKMYII